MRKLSAGLAPMLSLSLALAIVAGGAPWAAAQQQNRARLAITDPAEVDEDYHVQGEYVSHQGSWPRWGVQVVALGDGKFQAAVHQDGLPGAGYREAARYVLQGGREPDGVVRLTGETWGLEISPGRAALLAHGSPIAYLSKIERRSSTLGLRPYRNAVVLFDGSSLDEFEKAKFLSDGLLHSGATTKRKVQDFYLHLEFRTPYMPYARGQGRGNSGVYIQRRYELQVLDSFGLEGAANECGGLYTQRKPDLNMCLPPLVWQTYDIYFLAARFDADGKKIANARLTALLNGVPVHNNIEIANKTGAGQKEGPEALPIYLQDHGNPVAFRNIWMLEGYWVPSYPTSTGQTRGGLLRCGSWLRRH